MNANEPAYPVECDWSSSEIRGVQTAARGGWCIGLTKREYFAGLAMQGMLAANWPMEVDDYNQKQLASDAVLYADALLAALENKKERCNEP